MSAYGVRALFAFLLVVVGIIVSCGKEVPIVEEQFNLKKFELTHYDLYNPITNSFLIDQDSRKEHPALHPYDVYRDSGGVVRFFFFRSDSYGHLFKLTYDKSGKLLRTIVYPVLGGKVDQVQQTSTIFYFYSDGKLAMIRDDLERELIVLNGDQAVLYTGVLAPWVPFSMKVLQPNEYFIKFLSPTRPVERNPVSSAPQKPNLRENQEREKGNEGSEWPE